MDWDMKIPSWDLSELERDTEPTIGSVLIGSSSFGLAQQESRMDCSVDLKLGGLGDFGCSNSRPKEQPRVSSPTVSPPGPSKRARMLGNGSQNVTCLVDGCKSDLSNCRDYHRRHKVCEVHSKTPMVLVGGQQQRFCQQCSRFHLLVEFDEVKRSCRKRLDGHNRRRRKSQPEMTSSGPCIHVKNPVPASDEIFRDHNCYMSSASLLWILRDSFYNHAGPGFSSYPRIFPTVTSNSTRNNVVKDEEGTVYTPHPPLQFISSQQHFLDSQPHIYRGGRRFPFLQCNDASISGRPMLQNSFCQPLNTISFSSSSNNGGKLFPNRLAQVLDSDCALSLLSSPTQTPAINANHIVLPDRIPIAQPLAQSMQHYGGLGTYSRSESSNNVSPTGFSCSVLNDIQAGTVMISDSSEDDLQCPGFFHPGTAGSSNGPPNVLPFSWQ